MTNHHLESTDEAVAALESTIRNIDDAIKILKHQREQAVHGIQFLKSVNSQQMNILADDA